MEDSELLELARRALAEDIGSGDVTSEALVPADARAQGVIVQKQPGVPFGFAVVRACFRALDPACNWSELAAEGVWLDAVPAEIVRLEGSARALLGAERVGLNFLGRLSGIATLTARCVRAAEGSRAVILDTRKTTPGLRRLEKEAVRAGGGQNHRMGLYDAILIKGNHVALAGGVGEAVRRALASDSGLPLEVECGSLAGAEEALAAGAKRLLLDNMAPAELRGVVERLGKRAELEASGGISPETVAEVAATGVHFISMGALTHSAPALDLSLRISPL